MAVRGASITCTEGEEAQVSQAASRERICRRAVLPADTREKAVMWGRRAPGIIKEEYESFSSGHFWTPHMARTGM